MPKAKPSDIATSVQNAQPTVALVDYWTAKKDNPKNETAEHAALSAAGWRSLRKRIAAGSRLERRPNSAKFGAHAYDPTKRKAKMSSADKQSAKAKAKNDKRDSE